MLDHINRGWRVVGTGLSFFLFGVGGLLLRTLLFPAMNLFIREQEQRVALARNVIRFAFRALVGLMRGLRLMHYEVSGLQKLERSGLLIIANHPTLIDTVFLMAFVRRADCIVKNRLWDNPFTHGPVRAAGYINNEDGPGLIDKCIGSLKEGNNLIIFPEGTRTPPDGAISFKRGAANIAVRGKRNLTPVVIRCTPSTLGKGDRWWKVPLHPIWLRIEVQEDIEIQPFVSSIDGEALAARRLTEYLQSYFAEENKRHAIA